MSPGPSEFRPNGTAKTLSTSVINHAGPTNKFDLYGQAEKREAVQGPRPLEIEVIGGVTRANYIPALNKFVSDDELTEALREAGTLESRTRRVPRKDRPGKDRPDVAKGAVEYFHANYPPHVILALRWGVQNDLPNPTPALDANLIFGATIVEEEYGLTVVAIVRHTPNPYSSKTVEKLGWRSLTDGGIVEKIGGWNLHPQVYCARVLKGVYKSKRWEFSHCFDTLLSSVWLQIYGVDVHKMARATWEYEIRQAYRKNPLKKLPKALALSVAQHQITRGEAIDAVVKAKMSIWDARWLMAKTCTDQNKKTAYLLADKRKVQEPCDWFLSMKGTADLEERLVDLDPRYGPLLEKGRRVYAQLKTKHYEEGYRRTINDLLTEYEKAEAAAADAKKRADLEALEALAQEARAKEQRRFAALEAQNSALIANTRALEAGLEATKVEAHQLKDKFAALAETTRANEAAAAAAAKDAESQRTVITNMKEKLAAQAAAASKATAASPLFSPSYLLAAMSQASALGKEGKDLSSMSTKARQAVQIAPELRFKQEVVVVGGRREWRRVIGADGKALTEPNPIAGNGRLQTGVLGYVQTMIAGLKSNATNVVPSPEEAALLKGYEEVLLAHQNSLKMEVVDWEEAEWALERALVDGPPPGIQNFLNPKYEVMAETAAIEGNLNAGQFKRLCTIHKDRIATLRIKYFSKSQYIGKVKEGNAGVVPEITNQTDAGPNLTAV